MTTAPNFEEVGKAFVTHYYTLFDSNKRNELGALYQNESMLTFEQAKFQGRDAIIGKLTTLSFQSVKHQITAIDAQPSPGNGILVFVSGNLLVDESQNILKFSQVFNLLPTASAGYYVFNDVFQLNYG